MGLHAAGHAKGGGLALVPPVLFQPSSRLWLQGYLLVTSLEPRKAENPPGSYQFPQRRCGPWDQVANGCLEPSTHVRVSLFEPAQAFEVTEEAGMGTTEAGWRLCLAS